MVATLGDEPSITYGVVESLSWTPETNVTSYINYVSIKTKNIADVLMLCFLDTQGTHFSFFLS